MSINREAILSAVLAELVSLRAPPYSLTIPTISRDWKKWDATPQQPAIYLVSEKQRIDYQMGLLPKHLMWPMLWIYATRTPQLTAEQVINPILDAIEKRLFPPDGALTNPQGQPTGGEPYVNTLGGLVPYCAVKGEAHYNGYLGDQGIATFPLEILAT